MAYTWETRPPLPAMMPAYRDPLTSGTVGEMFTRSPRRFTNPAAVAGAIDPQYVHTPALREINDALVQLMDRGNDEFDSLAVSLPPQEGKSLTCSRRFPEWVLDQFPETRIAIVSYEQDIALRWGRDIKMDVTLNPCKTGEVNCPGCGGLHITIRHDSSAAGRWETPQGGGVYCVGVGGPLTSRAVDILIIDDPVKDRAAAESQKIRDSTWDWWESVGITRFGPQTKVVLIQCMTGDTPVLMGDGTEKPLRDVRPGDTVATYANGGLSTSTVRNWANQGSDSVFSIRMKSGTAVRANARHPFLTIQDGVETWQRTDKLKPGSRILRATGESGAASTVPAVTQHGSQGVTARGYASLATASNAGQTGTVHHRSTPGHAVRRICAIATASARRTMTGCSRSKAAYALSANEPIASLPIGSARFALITATAPGAYEGCSATTATLSSAMPHLKQSFVPPLTTYAIEADEVAEIVPAGTEDVYDLQVDRTENFIANGLVSHNTRWHEDDLAGRIFSRPTPRKWKQIVIPAIAVDNDPLGRKPGEELLSARGRAAGYFHHLRATMSAYVFAGIYQQTPTAPEGNFFRRATFRYWRWLPPWPDGRKRIDCEGKTVTLADCWTFITMDFAASQKSSADYTVASCWAITMEGDLLLLDRVRERVPDHQHFQLARPLIADWGVQQVYVESNWWSSTFVTDARDNGIPVALVRADTDKVTRAIPAAGRVHSGKAWWPAEAKWLDVWCDELAIFPQGTHDDQVDTLSYAARVAVNDWTAVQDTTPPGLHPVEDAANHATASATGHSEIDPFSVPF